MYITQSFYVYTNRSYYIDCVASTFMEYFPLRPYCGTTLSGLSLSLSSSPMTLPLTYSSPATGASCFSCTMPSLFLSSGLCTYCSLCLEHSSTDFLMGSPLPSLGSQRGLPDHPIQRKTTHHFLDPHLALFFIPFLNTYDIIHIIHLYISVWSIFSTKSSMRVGIFLWLTYFCVPSTQNNAWHNGGVNKYL